jgi:capsular exopolysaccharide synthesis family protein
LAAQVKAEAIANTELLRIAVEDADPARAKGIAEALAALLLEKSQSLYFGGARSAREILQEQVTMAEDNLGEDRAALQVLLSSSDQDEKKTEAQRTKIGLEEEFYASLLKQYEQARLSEVARANSVTIIEPAVLPYAPSKPRTRLNLMLGTLVGLVGGLGLALVFESLDPILHSEDDLVTLTKVPMLGSIPKFRTRGRGRPGTVVLGSNGQSRAGEAYRVLRGNIMSLASDAPLKALLIAGAEPRAGKSTVLVNLAAAMAEAGRRVIIVDSDLRRPSLHQVLSLPNELGLSNVILKQTAVDAALQETGIPSVKALTSGPYPPNVAELLGSPKLQELIQALAQRADVVLLDSPPISLFADAAALATVVDGVLFVVAQDQATGRGVQQALQQMDHVRARALGIVFNKASARKGKYY